MAEVTNDEILRMQEVITRQEQALTLLRQQMDGQNQTITQQGQALSQAATVQQITQALSAGFAASRGGESGTPGLPMLVDNKGLGRPPVSTGKDEQFERWATKVQSYICGVHADLEGPLDWALEQDCIIPPERPGER